MYVFFLLDAFIIAICIIAGYIIATTNRDLRKNNNFPTPLTDNNARRFAVLIPARYEAKVIAELLKSIQTQNYYINPHDVYIIVEDLEDPTCLIAAQHNNKIIVREKIHLQRKGFALDEGVKHILNLKIKYDAYFIIDADNILDENFFSEMHKAYNDGYDIALGYRKNKNASSSTTAACSGLTFSLLNTLGNLGKVKNSANITISGSGLFIKGELIESWGGFPFNSLTEDYELGLYATLNGLKTAYIPSAYFYDEQPKTPKESRRQRLRWVKGYIESRKKYIPAIKNKMLEKNYNYPSQVAIVISIVPYVMLIVAFAIGILLNSFIGIFLLSTGYANAYLYLLKGLFYLIVSYVVLVGVTLTIFIIEHDYSPLSKKMKWRALLFNPVFLAEFAPIAIKAFFAKEVQWDRIEHTEVEVT